jgi:nitroreductase
MPLDTLTAINNRFACRNFSSTLPDADVLRLIADAGLAAPSSQNRQPWEIRLVTNSELRNELETEVIAAMVAAGDPRISSEGGKPFYGAPCLVVIAKQTSFDAAALNCGIVAQNIALAATALGVDNLVCGRTRLAFAGGKRDYFSERLELSTGYEFAVSVLLWHSSEPAVAPHAKDQAKLKVIV